MSGAPGRWRRRAGLGLLLLAAGGLGELGLRRGGIGVLLPPRPTRDGRRVILCVGDSHTRGWQPSDNLPAALQALLDAHAPGRWRVVNVGVPGLNTAQLRNRFERYLAYYRPAVVIHWAGINNIANWAEWRAPTRLEALADRLATPVLLRALFVYPGAPASGFPPPLVEFESQRGGFRVVLGGVSEEIGSETGRQRTHEQIEQVTVADVGFMMTVARAWGIPMYLIKYISFSEQHRAVRRALDRVAAASGVPPVDTDGADRIARRTLPPGSTLYDPYLHPMGPVYRVVAARVYDLLVDQRVVTPAP